MKMSITYKYLAALAVATAFAGTSVAQTPNFGPTELVEAAKEEGRLVLYTSNQIESEQDLVAAFNERFPEIQVELVRAPGSRLATRISSELAANQLSADVIDMSDRGLVESIIDAFAEYTPPNADAYPQEVKSIPNVWPKTTWGFILAYNKAAIESGPSTWKGLTDEAYRGQVGLVIANSGGSTWTTAMFQRQVLGEDYWKSLSANEPVLYPSGSPAASALVRGEVLVGAVQSNAAIPIIREGAPLEAIYPEEGVPLTPSAAGVTKTAAHPNAAKLYLNWSLSEEGQKAWVEGQGGFSSLPSAGLPEGAEGRDVKTWLPDPEEYVSLRNDWISEWNQTFNAK